MRIAVFTDTSGAASEPVTSASVHIYDKSANSWQLQQTTEVIIQEPKTLGNIRSYLHKLIEELNDCKIIVASKMLGASYNFFDRAGFHIWEFEGHPETFLPVIEQKEIIDSYELPDATDPFALFTDDGEGCYSINIKKILFNDHTLTSKKLLLPFLDHKHFYQLDVIFSHLPPWLEPGLKKRGLKKELIDHQIDEHRILIRHETCTDN